MREPYKRGKDIEMNLPEVNAVGIASIFNPADVRIFTIELKWMKFVTGFRVDSAKVTQRTTSDTINPKGVAGKW